MGIGNIIIYHYIIKDFDVQNQKVFNNDNDDESDSSQRTQLHQCIKIRNCKLLSEQLDVTLIVTKQYVSHAYFAT